MSNTRSKIDSLQELNSQLIATIADLRKENAEILDCYRYDHITIRN
ncbi:3978_t:CDS:1, partial [Ambispora gerdemannii]